MILGGIGLVVSGIELSRAIFLIAGSFLLVICAGAVFSSRSAWKGPEYLTTGGLVLIVLGFLVFLFALALLPTVPLDDRTLSTFIASTQAGLLLALISGLLLWLGVAILPWQMAHIVAKALVIAGSLLSLYVQVAAYSAVSMGLDGATNVSEVADALASVFEYSLLSFLGTLIAAAGYVVAGAVLWVRA